MNGRLRAEITHEPLQRIGRFVELIIRVDVAVVITRNRKNGGGIMIVRFIEFPVVVLHLPIVIDHVTEMIEERRVRSLLVIVREVKLHVGGNLLLICRGVYTAGITYGM